jgi:hypothetical protein
VTRAGERVIEEWSADAEVEVDLGARPGEYVVALPGEAKQRITVSLLVGDRGLTASAFVVRRPDENHAEFYRWLLTRNARLPGLAFALDRIGDVYLVARIPNAGVTVEVVDELMGAILTTADAAFNDLLALGFLSSIRKEWSWRISRGESTHNLEAFRHLMEE